MPDFSAFNRRTAQSFMQHKQLIKTLLSGKPVACPSCGQPLQAQLPNDAQASVAQIRCSKGCTDIELETTQPLR